MNQIFEHKLACGFHPRVKVDGGTGKVFVRGWEGSDVKIAAEGAEPDVSSRGDRVLVHTEENCQLSLYLPRSCDLTIEGGNMEVDVAGISGTCNVDICDGYVALSQWQGNVHIDTTNAGVRLEQVEGNLDLDTAAGPVEVIACQGSLTADTSAGPVKVTDCLLSLSVDTGSGDVSVSRLKGAVSIDCGSGAVELVSVNSHNLLAESGAGDITAQLPGGNPGRWRLRSGKDVNLTVPANISARFRLSGRNIDADSLDMEQLHQGGDKLSGTIAGGSGRVDVQARGKIVAQQTGPDVIIDVHQRTENEEETLKILAMVEQGAISIEEAEKLIDALTGGGIDE